MLLSLLVAALLAVSSIAIYRLFFHPLAKVPGPKLATATSLYEFYYDCVLGGKYAFKIPELHKQYGPCIRINPQEVHISDPAYWDILYNHSNKLDKDPWYYGGFGVTVGSIVATPSHDLHRIRRGAMSTYFSSTNVRKLEPIVLERVARLCDRFEELKDKGLPVNLNNAFRCLATDVVTHFAFPKPRSFLSSPDFAKDFTRLLRDFSALITWQRHIPVVLPILTSIPEAVTLRMDKTAASRQMIEYQRSFVTQSQMAVDRRGKPDDGSAPSILDAIAASQTLSEGDKSTARIAEEAQIVVGAGTETMAGTLAVLIYYLLADPELLAQLKRGLAHAAGVDKKEKMLDLKALERLPFLQAVITEALRIASPVSGRLPRVSPRDGMTYTSPDGGATYILPPGTVVSMSMRDLHFDPSIFPDPHTFNPDRWLQSSSEDLKAMQQAFVPFGRGSRNCIGQELAKHELTLTVGNLMHRFDFELFESTERDIQLAHDWFAPYAELDSEGLRVKVY